MSSGRPPTLWCDLIVAATPSRRRPTRSRPSRASPGRGSATSPSSRRLLLEDADELLADRSCASASGSVDARRAARGTAPAPATWTSGTWKWPLERLDDLRRLVLAQQAVVDEDAGRAGRRPPCARAARRPRSRRRPRARRARAREPTCARIRSTCSSITAAGVQVGRRAGDAVEEVLQHVLAVRRVHDLGVELDAVEARAPAPRTRRSASTASRRSTRAPVGRRGHGVAVAHPARSAPRQARRSSAPRRRASSVLPNSTTPVRSTRPPSSCAISCMP